MYLSFGDGGGPNMNGNDIVQYVNAFCIANFVYKIP